jgi:hypothetical protein
MHDRAARPRISIRVADVLALVLLSYSVYLCFDGKIVASVVAFSAASFSWFCGKRARAKGQHSLPGRVIDRYALNLAIALLMVAALSDFSRNLTRVDFGMFYSNALLLKRAPDRLYDVYLQADVLKEVSGIKEGHYLTFVYPPFVALLFVPFTLVSFKTAYYLMLFCNVALLCLVVWFLTKRLSLERVQVRALVLCVAAALPVYVTLILGHISFWGLLFLSLFCLDLLDGRDTRAGFWCGLLSYKISLLPVPLVVLMWLGLWRGFAVACGVMAVLAGISIGLVGFPGFLASLWSLRGMSTDSLLPRMHSLRSLTYFLGLGEWAWIALSVLAMAALWLAFARRGDRRWALAAMILSILLVTPYLHTHDLVLGIISLALVISQHPIVTAVEEKAFVLIAFLPVGVSIWLQSAGHMWPLMPVVLLGSFVYCLYRALAGREAGGHWRDRAVS